ncbi:MAG: hydrolase [Haloarculaceae archaeon]
MLGEWTGASVERGEDRPEPEVWTPVDVPGRPAAFAGADAVAYRTAFDDPRSESDDRATLVLDGLYASARVWLNGELVGTHDAYFRPFRHTFEPADRNELLVECRAPADRFGGIHDTDAVPDADAPPGIWWGARLETHEGTFVSDLTLRPRVDGGDAAIDVRTVVEAATDLDDRITFSLRPEGDAQTRGMMDRAPVQAAAGERAVVEHTIDVHDASLWWPRELGEQHRYGVRAKLDGDSRVATTGLCSIERDEAGLRVNGERVAARGFDLVDAAVADVERAVEANATLVRMHAHVPPDEVYAACDEAGLLVWQDLPLTGPGEFDVERGRELAAALDAARANHPSLAATTVHDDPVELFPGALGSGLLDRLRFRWRTWRASYDRGPAEAVADALPTNRPCFPVVGPVGIGADAVGIYPGWDYGDASAVGDLLERVGDDAAVAEFGAGALGDGDPAETAGFDAAKHAAHVDGEDVAASQAYQADVVSRVAEELRRRDAPALAAFALRDAGDAGMGVLERDGTPKAGYEAVATAYQPVQAMLTDPVAGAQTDVVVINDAPAGVAGTVEWTAGDERGEAGVRVDAHGRKTVGTVDVPGDAERVTLTLSVGDSTVENAYSL